MIAAESFLSVRPTGGFNLIMADPPWLFENYSEKGEEKNATAHRLRRSTRSRPAGRPARRPRLPPGSGRRTRCCPMQSRR